MIRALYSAASGMTAQQLNVDNIAHNLANANTVGYKTRRAQFQDLLYQTVHRQRLVQHDLQGPENEELARRGSAVH